MSVNSWQKPSKGPAMKRPNLFKRQLEKTRSSRTNHKNRGDLSFEPLEPRRLLAGDFAAFVELDITTDWAGIHGTGGTTDRGYNVAVQPDGKMVVDGVIAKSTWQASQDMLVARYNADGSIDTSFNGTGYNLVDFGIYTRDFGTSIALQSDGKILVQGTGFDVAGLENTLIAARFNTDGTLDATYSAQPFYYEGGGRILEHSSGKILMAGTAKPSEGENDDLLLTRLNSDFTLDTTFGIDGHVLYDFQGQGLANSGGGIEEQSDGKIVVGGSAQGFGYYVRFNADGSLDTSYASAGEGFLDTSVNGSNGLGQATLDANDNAYFSGVSDISADGTDTEIVVVKVDNTGTLDTGFGNGGIFRFDLTPGKESPSMNIDQIGNLIIRGRTDGISGHNGFMIRVSPDGTLDNGFGTVLLGLGRLRGRAVVDAANRPVVTGEIGQPDLRLVRINPNVEFADSFENGQLSDLWVPDGQNDWFNSSQRSTDGSNSVEVDGNVDGATLTAKTPINLSVYGTAELRFDWLIEGGFDTGEYLALDFLDEFGNWDPITSLNGNIDQEDVWHKKSIQINESQYLHDDFKYY